MLVYPTQYVRDLSPARSLLVGYGDPVTLLFPPPEDLHIIFEELAHVHKLALNNFFYQPDWDHGQRFPEDRSELWWEVYYGCCWSISVSTTYNRQVQVTHIPRVASCARGVRGLGAQFATILCAMFS